jgi:serine protease Do
MIIMKSKLNPAIAVIALLPAAAIAQTPPPSSPEPPPAQQFSGPPGHEKPSQVSLTFLGVETSPVPAVVSEQLGLTKGLGLVVDYVVPNSPAAAAGLQPNDILRMLNDQILVEPAQLRKLLQTFSEGAEVTLTFLRKGQEQKVTAKLAKKQMSQRHWWSDEHDWPLNFDEHGDFGEQMRAMKQQLREQLGNAVDVMREAAIKAGDRARRARDDARRAGSRLKIVTDANGEFRTTKIDLGGAEIVFRDDKGEMKLQTVNGKKLLTARDPRGNLIFSGPVETEEDLQKLPAAVRQRYEKFKQDELPAVELPQDVDEQNVSGADHAGGKELKLPPTSFSLVFHKPERLL